MKKTRSLALLLILFCMFPLLASAASSVQASLAKLSDDELLQLKAYLDDELASRGLALDGDEAVRTTRSSGEPLVWIPKSGSKYHSKSTCSNMSEPTQVSLDVAKSLGFSPCKKCKPPK